MSAPDGMALHTKYSDIIARYEALPKDTMIPIGQYLEVLRDQRKTVAELVVNDMRISMLEAEFQRRYGPLSD
ncbi:hypothetical protein [Nocardia sp. NPDC127526]|uniref:hypothetical protein n=1 Tax=Nocardia sp. NPDC127526 TaxID=3345393 RepID=UPI0036256853